MSHVLKTALAAIVAALIPHAASAHDVSASSVKVIVGENGALEVWQTTPHITAREIAGKLNPALSQSAVVTDMHALSSMALGWRVSSTAGDCSLGKQAYRRIHDQTQLQMRYLFTCPNGARPAQVSLAWLTQAPQEHFIFLELNANGTKRTKIFERQRLSITIPASSGR